MSRIDPRHYPDRFAFEAHARRLQSQEMSRLWVAAWQWLESQGRALVHPIGQAIAHRGPHAGPQLPH